MVFNDYKAGGEYMGKMLTTETYLVKEAAEVTYSNVSTGADGVGNQLLYQLKMCIRNANKIDIVVSFLMTSGIKLIIDDLKKATERGVNIRILTGRYLNITQPEALYIVKQKLGDYVELRMYDDNTRSFHPKAYMFEFDDCCIIFVGSSNISRSALTNGIEWNYNFRSDVEPENFKKFKDTFQELWNEHSYELDDERLLQYSKSWHKPAIYQDFKRFEHEGNTIIPLYEPRGAQIEALYALQKLRQDGGCKGLVQAATGIGKTYLAAFDSREFKRVLFIAHREEILHQAVESFGHVHSEKTRGYFMGSLKDTSSDLIFASVATLGQEKYLAPEYFERDAFDYIVIDEFHHAVTDYYQRIMSYFQPKFLLGLTATPERMDGRDIFALCDYNVPYEIGLAEAINKGFLVPFHYYGIYDDTDYNDVERNAGHYQIQSLTRAYLDNGSRNTLIMENYRKFARRQALGFCCSREHAEAMAQYFCENGVNAAAVYSGEKGAYAKERDTALEELKRGQLEIIFSVDMFNEGVDIKGLDLVMFLRPTESPVVFLQQLGRGLRQYHGKDYLVVLDFIGNYINADRVQTYLTSDYQYGRDTKKDSGYHVSGETPYPDNCFVDFDVRLIDLLEKLKSKKQNYAAIVDEEFQRICTELGGRHPTRLELFNQMSGEIYSICMSKPKINPFKDYLGFLNRHDCLTSEENDIIKCYGREFINWLENTNMTKVYKMPVLESFLDNGRIKESVSKEEVLLRWKSFFGYNRNWRDLSDVASYTDYLNLDDRWHTRKIIEMPIKFLKNSGAGYVKDQPVTDENFLEFDDRVKEILSMSGIYEHVKDILAYRVQDYYWRRYKNKDNLSE
ncbi:HKD family nuclease fused to DNA/RNA helicases of superfamily II [Anaerovibrio sp. JC8]|uniref:DEAD/DEAH box helicase family protein n=1 Tax=Anaerovibrio sp. JC8 TaxID=1240085 RepID=UPI000A0A862A|nr:DEAD/DEAH box helicase family protein [Anaerovibrio sp. JC8]ORT99861.1 HKD family nuclease fused to DNA/RNA helicases of superfamily II [Anaerovibrio sp. JC8]